MMLLKHLSLGPEREQQHILMLKEGQTKKQEMTEVGFEPTLSLEKRRFKKILKSSALDHSAIPPLS